MIQWRRKRLPAQQHQKSELIRFEPINYTEITTMSREMSLEGTRFLKYDEYYGLEECHVLKHEKKGGRYLVAFVLNTPGPNDRQITGVGKIKGNISWVHDFILEGYATQDQEKIAKLKKIDRKRRALMTKIIARAQKHRPEPAPAPAPPPGSSHAPPAVVFEPDLPF
jgi:hypothetical protein